MFRISDFFSHRFSSTPAPDNNSKSSNRASNSNNMESAKRKINILDLSLPLIEQIILFSFEKSYRKEEPIIAPTIRQVTSLSLTCKTFYKALKNCLTDDVMWVNRYRGEFCAACFKGKCMCPFYRTSWKSRYPKHSIGVRCNSCGPCRNTNSIIRFYTFSTSLSRLNLSGVFLSLRRQDAKYILQFLIDTKPPIREIRFEWHESTYIPKFKPAMTLLSALFKAISGTLNSIVVNGFILSKTPILKAICSHPLPNITKIDFSTDLRKREGKMALSTRVVTHCLYSGSKLEKIRWDSVEEKEDFLNMTSIKPFKTYLSENTFLQVLTRPKREP